MSWVVTDHAVGRYIERVSPGTSLEEAQDHLAEATRTAPLMRAKSYRGQSCYRAEDCILVVRDNRRERRCDRSKDRTLVVVTVLPLAIDVGVEL